MKKEKIKITFFTSLENRKYLEQQFKDYEVTYTNTINSLLDYARENNISFKVKAIPNKKIKINK